MMGRVKIEIPERGWEPWQPSPSSTGMCACKAAFPFARMYRKGDQLRCHNCVPQVPATEAPLSDMLRHFLVRVAEDWLVKSLIRRREGDTADLVDLLRQVKLQEREACARIAERESEFDPDDEVKGDQALVISRLIREQD